MSTPTDLPPTNLPPRYEIRQLGLEHLDWVSAIQLHANVFHSEKWQPVFAGDPGRRCLKGLRLATPTLAHSLRSGLSYGVFDTEYVFKRVASKMTDGAIYWATDFDEDTADDGHLGSNEEVGKALLDSMDFPLVTMALAFDGIDPQPRHELAGLGEAMPEMTLLYSVMDQLRKKNEEAAAAADAKMAVTARGQLVRRFGTATRRDYEGRGLMKALAHFEMRLSKLQGFRTISINTSNPAVQHVWMNPPPPFRGEVVLRLSVKDHSMLDGEGREIRPFLKSGEKDSMNILCHLQEEPGT